MAMWVSETSDEDFIPQHRIKYFKWDREGRVDKIFGSGLTGSTAEECENEDEDVSGF